MRTYEDGLGGSITLLEEGDEERPTRFRMVMPPGFGPPAPECHPSQTEHFEVLRGTLDLGDVHGEHVVLHEGDPAYFRQVDDPLVRQFVAGSLEGPMTV